MASEVNPVLGPPPVITQASVEKSIIKMKKGKVPGPSGVTEILKASSDVHSKMITDLTNSQTLLLTHDSL